MELSYQVVLIEGQPAWSGRAKHFYGHLLFLDIASGVHDVRILQIAHPEVIPHGIRYEGLQRPLGLRALDKPGDYFPPGLLPRLIAQLWPDASQDPDSDLYTLLTFGEDPHHSPWRYGRPAYSLPTSLLRLFTEQVLQVLDVRRSLVAGALATLLIATAPEEFRLAVEDVVALCEYLRNCHPSLRQGVTSQLLILCNRTAVHNLLLQHGFQIEWHGAMRVSTTSSGAGATSRIAVIVQTGCGFLSGGRRGATYDDMEDCYGRATVALTRAIEYTYIVSPPDMAGLIGMAQT